MRDWFWPAAVLSFCFASSVRAAIAPPRVVEVDAATLPAVRHLATPPVRTLVGYTRRVLHLRDRHTLGVFSYSNSTAANWLFLIDARDLSSKRVPSRNNDIASHSAALGSDGNIYVMPYGTPRAYRFDVKREKFEPIAVGGLPAGEYTWDAIGGADGCIYFGTYPNACLGRYEIVTGQTKIWPHVAADATYVTDFSVEGDGVYFRAWGPGETWMRIDATAAAPAKIQQTTTRTATTRTATTTASTTMTEPAPHDVAPGESAFVEEVDGATITIGHYGSLTRREHASGKVTRGRLDNLAPGGNSIMFIEAVTPDCVVGANYSQQHLFRVDPSTGVVQVSDEMIARTPGQPMCAVALGGKAYLGIYIQSIFLEYDPAKPIAWKTNPREIGEVFRTHQQTRPVAAATDGTLVFFATEGDYNRLGGALTVIDPVTAKVDAYPQPAKDQNLTSLAYDPKHKLLWAGTNRWGQMRSAPPTQKTAVMFAFDPAKREPVALLTPWEATDHVAVLGCTDDGIVVATANGEVVMIDGDTRRVAHRGAWPVTPTRMRRGSDGRLYFLASERLWRWNVSDNTLAAVAVTGGATMLAEFSPGRWVVADATSVYRVALSK